MDALAQSPFHNQTDVVVTIAHFLEPGDYECLSRTCKKIQEIIRRDNVYWTRWCLDQGYQKREGETSYFTFCRMDNSCYRRGQVLGNAKSTPLCSFVGSISGMEENLTYQRRAVNPLTGNLLCMVSVAYGAFLERDPSIPLSSEDILCDQLHEISADSGKIVKSAPLPGLFSSTLGGMGMEKMKVVSNKLLLISNRIFFAIDLVSLQISRRIEFPSSLSNCTDVTGHGGTYFFLTYNPNPKFLDEYSSQIHCLNENDDSFMDLGFSQKGNLRFFENLLTHVSCYDISSKHEYHRKGEGWGEVLASSCRRDLIAPHFNLADSLADPLDSGSFTMIDLRFTAYAWKASDKMVICGNRIGDFHMIKIPPYQSAFHLGVRENDLILYIDSAIYSIKTSPEQ